MARHSKRSNGNATPRKRKADVLYDQTDSFQTECPARPTKQAPSGVTDVYKDRDHPGVEELAIDFNVRPGSKWVAMKGYTNVKYQDQTFSARDFIFVNKMDPPPRPPPEDAPPEEVLKYQRDNMWIGRIQQVKAETPQRVWVRVCWLYWPEELPMGAQHYHGRAELILSNYTDIVDATTISGRADISHWDEFKDGDDDRDLNPLYWRQTLDCSRLGPKNKGGLSMLRKHCICRKEYNPDKTMFKCLRTPDCGIWNHSECLEDDLRNELEMRLERRSLLGYLDRRAAAFEAEQEEQQKSLGNTIAVGATAVASAATKVFSHAMHAIEGTTSEVETDTSFDAGSALLKSPARGRKKAKGGRSTNRLQISISSSVPGSENDNGAVTAKVRLLSANEAVNEEKQWTIKLDCLKCGKPLD